PGGISFLGFGKKGYVVKSIVVRIIRERIVRRAPAEASDLRHRIVSYEDDGSGRVGRILRGRITVAPGRLAFVIEKAGGLSTLMEVANVVKILGLRIVYVSEFALACQFMRCHSIGMIATG